MRYAKLMVVLVGFAATLCAADPFVGTWKLNAAKSKYNAGTAPKEQTVTIAEAGTDLNVKVTGTAADGTKIAYNYTVPAKGGTGKVMGTAPFDAVSSKRAGANDREITYMNGGKNLYTIHSKVAADGNALTVAAKGVNATGQPVDAIAMYDKQK